MIATTSSLSPLDSNNILLSIQDACQSWKAFEWESKRSVSETTLLQAKEARELSSANRKQLSESTKQFKRAVKTVEQTSADLETNATTETVNATVKSVEQLSSKARSTVKSFQEEVDSLTRRCKSAETAYAGLTSSLLELPDPALLLQLCCEQLLMQQAQMAQLLQTVDQVSQESDNQEKAIQMYKKEISTLKSNLSSTHAPSATNTLSLTGGAVSSSLQKEEKDELQRLRREVAEYEIEFKSLKNQDITIRKLEAKISEMQVAAESYLQEQLEKVKEELVETEGRRASDALEREAAMERRVESLQLQLKAERAGYAATQAHLLEADEGVSHREAAWEAQRQILLGDAERLRESLQAASRERDELQLRLAALQGTSNSKVPAPPSSLGGGVSVKDLILERKAYEAEVAELSDAVATLREELRVRDISLAEERSNYMAKIEELEREVSSFQSQVVSLESQLASSPSTSMVESMKRELRILKRLEYNAHDVDADRDPEIAGFNEDESKDLESVLVAKLRRAESELVAERIRKNELLQERDSLKTALTEACLAKEEADKLVFSLEKDLEHAISTPSKSYKKLVTPSVRGADSSGFQGVVTDLEASFHTTPDAATATTHSVSAAEKAEDDHSVATIVLAQRDRLRARCELLEAERDSFKRELQIQVQSSESLKTDNTKLYEKVRYLQSYNKAPHSRGGFRADRDLDLEALEQRYEASVDPFRQFSKAERQRKLNDMPPMERTVFLVAKTFLATKEMRTALFFYVLAMHMLVFITTYHWSHAGGCHEIHDQLSHLPPAIQSNFKELAGQNIGEKSGAALANASGGN